MNDDETAPLVAEIDRLRSGLKDLIDNCPYCKGTGAVDSGGYTPWDAPIDILCPDCELLKNLLLGRKRNE